MVSSMSDRNDEGRGTVMLFAAHGMTQELSARLAGLQVRFFDYPDIPAIKIYIFDMARPSVASFSGFDAQAEWFAPGTRFFVGRCNESCAESGHCVRPGCRCEAGRCR